MKKPSQECRHVWYGPDEEQVFVCGICGAERQDGGGASEYDLVTSGRREGHDDRR